jgi:shikimate kinase
LRIERVVLLGFMGSGKSSVGESLARRLEWRFLDFDVEIERREGRAVADVIDTEGEDTFREMEAALTEEVASAAFLVLAPGGGWITQPELLDRLGPGTLSVWLDVSPAETVRRVNEDPADRPFKNHPDAVAMVEEMRSERLPLYERADLRIPTDGRTVEELAFEIEQFVRSRPSGSDG